MSATSYEHIYTEGNGIPFIKDTNTKVSEIVSEHLAYGWSPEEIQYQHNYLTLGQIYSALAYYWDHYEEMNSDLKEREQKISNIRTSTLPSILQNKLKARKTG